jgi:putative transposase
MLDKSKEVIKMSNQKSYPGDMTDAQAELLLSLVPPAKPGGRPRTVDIRMVINAIFYVLCTGCPWAWLPHDYPPKGTVYDYFQKWTKDGTWVKIHDQLRALIRITEGRHPDASAGVLDSQTVKVGTMVSKEVGYDGGKQIKGRKRFTLVDTFGLLMMVKVMAASVPEREGAKKVFEKMKESPEKYPRLIRIFVDKGFSGKDFMRLVMDTFGFILEAVLRSDKMEGFVVLPKRWVVERTFGWFNYWRRLSKDYEVLPETSEAFIYIGMTRLMLRRLA